MHKMLVQNNEKIFMSKGVHLFVFGFGESNEQYSDMSDSGIIWDGIKADDGKILHAEESWEGSLWSRAEFRVNLEGGGTVVYSASDVLIGMYIGIEPFVRRTLGGEQDRRWIGWRIFCNSLLCILFRKEENLFTLGRGRRMLKPQRIKWIRINLFPKPHFLEAWG